MTSRFRAMSFSPGEKLESLIVAADRREAAFSDGPAGRRRSSWSPEGAKLALGRSGADHTPMHLVLVDLQTGNVSAIRGSEGLFSPRWSPDGRSIVALSADLTRLALFELATGRWRDSSSGAGPWGIRAGHETAAGSRCSAAARSFGSVRRTGTSSPWPTWSGSPRGDQGISGWIGIALTAPQSCVGR